MSIGTLKIVTRTFLIAQIICIIAAVSAFPVMAFDLDASVALMAAGTTMTILLGLAVIGVCRYAKRQIEEEQCRSGE